MEWKNWLNIPLNERKRLPSCSGIYLVADSNNFVWYVGQATNVKDRWAGRSHHRYPQLIRSHRKLDHRIYWTEVSVNCLDEQEQYYIDLFQPELNGCKVKSYLPKQPQVEREIKRLLKVINNKTFLFPVIRSVVAGQYEDESKTRCLVIVITVNDWQLLFNSSRKQYATEVRKAWTGYQTYCGKDEHLYNCLHLPAYTLNGYRFEFVESRELLDYLEKNYNALNSSVDVVELFGVQVQTLKTLNILEEVSLEEEWNSYINEKKSLKPAAYISYRKFMLKALTGQV